VMNLKHAEKVLHNCMFLVAVLETKRSLLYNIRTFRCPANEDW